MTMQYGDMYGGPRQRPTGAPVPNLNVQPSLSSMFPGLSPSNYGHGAGRIPIDPFASFMTTADLPVLPSTGSFWGDLKQTPGVGLVPGLGTAATWSDSGPWGRGLNVGLDAIDLATFGLGRGITTPLRMAPNPLNVLRHIPWLPYGDSSTFVRAGMPPGSPHFDPFAQLPEAYSGTILPLGGNPPRFHPDLGRYLDIPEGGFNPSINWLGTYPREAGISSHQVLPDPQDPLRWVVRNPGEREMRNIFPGAYIADEPRGMLQLGFSPRAHRGMYIMEGHPVPKLGADYENLIDPQKVQSYYRADPGDFRMLSGDESAEAFKNYDIYGRRRVPGGSHPFQFLPKELNYLQVNSLPYQLPLTTTGRAGVNLR